MAPQYDDLPALVNSDSDSNSDEGKVAPVLLIDIPAIAVPVFFFFFLLFSFFYSLSFCRSTDDRIFGLLVETVQYSTSMAFTSVALLLNQYGYRRRKLFLRIYRLYYIIVNIMLY